ncbi:hypothetical protein GRJ2_002179400 [Grus japonensis]|uniref:Uncharacterized protein n=1 Tax=Grus japonensis TaxID=30415 RepID=A0ABC9XHH4_GRUJA
MTREGQHQGWTRSLYSPSLATPVQSRSRSREPPLPPPDLGRPNEDSTRPRRRCPEKWLMILILKQCLKLLTRRLA